MRPGAENEALWEAWVTAARAAEASTPTTAKPIAVERDVFQTQHEIQRVMHGPWRRAERL